MWLFDDVGVAVRLPDGRGVAAWLSDGVMVSNGALPFL